MPVTSGVFGKLDCPQGVLSRIWYNSSTNAATVDVLMCNKGTNTAVIRIAIIPAYTDTPNSEDYIVYNQPVDAGSTFTYSGIVMSTQETMYVYADSPDVAARVHGFINDLGPAATDIGMATYVNAGLTQYASGFDISSEDKAATPKLVKAIVDAYGGGGGGMVTTGVVRMSTTLSRNVSEGYTLSVPTYQVGRNAISVFIDGILCQGGNDNSIFAYQEDGNSGSISTSIKLYDSYPAGTEVYVIV